MKTGAKTKNRINASEKTTIQTQNQLNIEGWDGKKLIKKE